MAACLHILAIMYPLLCILSYSGWLLHISLRCGQRKKAKSLSWKHKQWAVSRGECDKHMITIENTKLFHKPVCSICSREVLQCDVCGTAFTKMSPATKKYDGTVICARRTNDRRKWHNPSAVQHVCSVLCMKKLMETLGETKYKVSDILPYKYRD